MFATFSTSVLSVNVYNWMEINEKKLFTVFIFLALELQNGNGKSQRYSLAHLSQLNQQHIWSFIRWRIESDEQIYYVWSPLFGTKQTLNLYELNPPAMQCITRFAN